MTTEPAIETVRRRYAAASPGRLANLARDWRQALGHPAYPEAADRLRLILGEQMRREHSLAVAR